MTSRVRRRDVDDTTMGVVEAALADERAAKLKRNDPQREIVPDQPSGRGGEQGDPTKLDVGPIDQTISPEMIAKAAKHRSLLRSENAARSTFRVPLRKLFRASHSLPFFNSPCPKTLNSAWCGEPRGWTRPGRKRRGNCV